MHIVLYTTGNGRYCGTQLFKTETYKIIRSSIAQDRLDSLALISIENDAARKLNLDELVDRFAQSKARKKERVLRNVPPTVYFFPSSTVVHFQTYRFILFLCDCKLSGIISYYKY